MKQDYLAIIRKADLVDLFKYGEFHIRTAVPFNGVLSEEDSNLFKAVTSGMNPFEYSFEYAMIHWVSNSDSSYFKVNIEDVESVFAFDWEAKNEFEGSLDSRLEIKVSPWSQEFENLKRRFQINGSFKGISNVWALFDLDEEDRNTCEAVIPSADIERAYKAMLENLPLASDDSIWVHVLRYERHSFYPRDVRGYFMDAIHIVCEHMNHGEAPTSVAEQTNVGQEILKLDSRADFKTVLGVLQGTDFDEKSKQMSRSSFVTVAPLFLFLKGSYAQNPEIVFSKRYIKYCKEIGEQETALAAYLLGVTLGHDKTYDAYYDKLPLKIFKEKIIESTLPEPTAEPTPEPTSLSEEKPIYALPGESQRISSVPASLFDDKPSYSNSNEDVIAIAYKGKGGQKNLESFYPVASLEILKEMAGNGYRFIASTELSRQLSKEAKKNLKILQKKADPEVQEYILKKYGIIV